MSCILYDQRHHLNVDQSPLPPPEYLNDRGQPHTHGMLIDEVPVCDRCGDQPESLARLEQHGRALKHASKRTSTARSNSRFPGRISLSSPLDPISDFQPGDRLKQLDAGPPFPTWMNLLPSSVSGTTSTSQYTLMRRRSTFPLYESIKPPTPPDNSPDSPEQDPEDVLALAIAIQGLSPIPSMQTLKGNAKHPYQSTSTSYPPKARVTDKIPRPDVEDIQPWSKSLSRVQAATSEVQPLLADSPPGQTLSSPDPSPLVSISRKSTRLQKTPLSATSCLPPAAVRKSSATNGHGSCGGLPHSAMPSQKIDPARPPFYKELSGFFTRRTGRWVLPSRVSEDRLNQYGRLKHCPRCGGDMGSQSRFDTSGETVEQGTCRSCQGSNGIPGRWS